MREARAGWVGVHHCRQAAAQIHRAAHALQRPRQLSGRAAGIIAAHGSSLRFHDQDVFNLLCMEGGWVELEHKWNTQASLCSCVRQQVITMYEDLQKALRLSASLSSGNSNPVGLAGAPQGSPQHTPNAQ